MSDENVPERTPSEEAGAISRAPEESKETLDERLDRLINEKVPQGGMGDRN